MLGRLTASSQSQGGPLDPVIDGTLWLLLLSFLIWDSCQGADGHGGVRSWRCEIWSLQIRATSSLSLSSGEEKPGPLSSPSPLLCKIIYIPHLAIQGQVRWGQDSWRAREQSVADIQILCIWNLTSGKFSVIKSLALELTSTLGRDWNGPEETTFRWSFFLGSRSSVLIVWTRYTRCSVLDSHGT